MWKLTTSLMFLEGGVVASVLGEYVPNVGDMVSYPPHVLQRIFVNKAEAIEVYKQILSIDPGLPNAAEKLKELMQNTLKKMNASS